jgi:hypothetical protein
MSQADTSKNNIFKFWGKVATRDEAVDLSKAGAAAAFICAGVTAVAALAAVSGYALMPGFNAWALLDAALFAGLGWGVWRFSRVAAIFALVLYLAERAMMFSQTPSHLAVITVMFIIFFVNGIRGTVAYHRLQRVTEAEVESDV